jgi:hypothetical protein
MAGDPDLAFQVEYGDWVLRMDYAHEIGNGSFLWRKDSEDAAEREFELFAHGTPTRLAYRRKSLNSAGPLNPPAGAGPTTST